MQSGSTAQSKSHTEAVSGRTAGIFNKTAAAALLCSALAAPAWSADLKAQDLFASGRSEVIIGVEDLYYPFSFVKEDGSRSGFDFDFSNEVCSRLEVKCVIKSYPFSDLIPALLKGEIDLIAASLGETQERIEMGLAFTQPYYHGKSLYLTNDMSMLTVDDNTVKGKILASQESTIQLELLHRYFADSAAEIRAYDTYDELLAAVCAGEVDVVYLDGLSAVELIKSSEARSLNMIIDNDTSMDASVNYARLAVRSTDAAALEELNKTLKDLTSSPEYQRLSLKYFPFIIY